MSFSCRMCQAGAGLLARRSRVLQSDGGQFELCELSMHGLNTPGAMDWQPSAYSPRTRLVYIPHQNLCQDKDLPSQLHRGHALRRRGRQDVRRAGQPSRPVHGLFTAWDPIAASRLGGCPSMAN
jgi:hypothetical protein